ncbi:uncharacterized protein [Epargyreus clarus]|uniref:uncharacterized protein n=1 Tax=Epargyreus clarus TaxID=520877 RepID=UPI003C2CA1EB
MAIMRFIFALPLLRGVASQAGYPPEEIYHYPLKFQPKPSPIIEGSDYSVPGDDMTPDYREPEKPLVTYKEGFYKEENRPYRMSPHYIQYYRWSSAEPKDNPKLMGCYCCTVYKRLTPLAGCAVITTRHILTTATSTELVLKEAHKYKNLENILGAWYDHDANVWNSSMYMTPARIHYHPRYLRPSHVNVSHPLPVTFDLALWAATYPFYGSFFSWSKAAICSRGGSHPFSYASSTPRGELLMIVGFQYIRAWKRRPMPWFKYAVRTRDQYIPCPKTEWGWFYCVPANWAKFGIDSGAALHRSFEGRSWRYDGLIAMHAFSMRLRSDSLSHYFIPVDTHPVLDWLYSSYMGRLPYEYLDYRFYDSQWRSPVPKPWFWIPWNYEFGKEPGYWNGIPFHY